LLAIPFLRAFFQLVPLPMVFNVAIGVLTLAWMFLQRWIWRSSWFERFLDLV
jgi:cation-transporting ATPase E